MLVVFRPMSAVPPLRPPVATFVVLAALAFGAIAIGLVFGPTGFDGGKAWSVLLGGGDETTRSILLELRAPRVASAFGVGALLALAGVLLQAVFRNPLADPYVLGVSGGAAVGALLTIAVGASAAATQSGALAGAFLAMLIVQTIGGRDSTRLLLTGVVVASACGALVSVLLALADASELRGMVFWLAGDLGWATNPWTGAGLAAVGVVLAVVFARPLNVLAAGELRASSVGLDPRRWRHLVFICCAALTAAAVVSAGTIGFVGLVTPHAARLLYRSNNHRVVAPAAALLGGTVLVLADLAARTLFSPRQLPVGAVMAVIGAPLFLLLLRGGARQSASG